jgi:hypothetical protein
MDVPRLTIQQILAWADAYRAQTGRWPNRNSGQIPNSSGEKWSAVDKALTNGRRGFVRGGSLAKLLYEHRNVPNSRMVQHTEAVYA